MNLIYKSSTDTLYRSLQDEVQIFFLVLTLNQQNHKLQMIIISKFPRDKSLTQINYHT